MMLSHCQEAIACTQLFAPPSKPLLSPLPNPRSKICDEVLIDEILASQSGFCEVLPSHTELFLMYISLFLGCSSLCWRIN